MTDWKLLARARDLQISDADLARIVPALESLQRALEPLIQDLPQTLEPALILSESAVRAR